MIFTIDEFHRGAQGIVATFNTFAQANGLQGKAKADHICYKCVSHATFERLRTMFESSSAFVYQSLISQRRIAYVKLTIPIETDLGPIYFVELSDQKPDNSQSNAFDHVEIFPSDGDYEALIEDLSDQGVELMKVERPHHTSYDIALPNGFEIKVAIEPLVQKITREEMNIS